MRGFLPISCIFWICALIMICFSLPPLYTFYFKEPVPLDSVDFNGDFEDLYVSGTLYGIYGWYCEEIENYETTARQYLIDAGNYYYMGLRADYGEMTAADKLAEASEEYLDGTDDGTLLQQAQYEVYGTIKPLDNESLKYYHESVDWENMDRASKSCFLPYYLEINNLGYCDYNTAVFVAFIGVIIFVIGLCPMIYALAGLSQKTVKKYILSSTNPNVTRERIDYFLRNTPEIKGLRYNRDYICGQHNGIITFGEMSKLTWISVNTTIYKEVSLPDSKYNFLPITRYAVELGFEDGSKQLATVKNAAIAREHIKNITAICPHNISGYKSDLDKVFRKDIQGPLDQR